MYLWFNIIIFSILIFTPVAIYRDLNAPSKDTQDIINIVLTGVFIILAWFSHASAIHQCDEKTGYIKSFRLAYQDTVIYIKLFLNIG